jgi:hypothetical protein
MLQGVIKSTHNGISGELSMPVRQEVLNVLSAQVSEKRRLAVVPEQAVRQPLNFSEVPQVHC